MAFVTRTPHRLARQDGIALPVSVLSLMLVLSLSGLVLQQSMAVGDSANREQRSKRAIQAADAGLDVAVFRVSKLATRTQFCPVVGGTGFAGFVTIGGQQWCPEVQEDLGDGKIARYRVSAPDAAGNRRIVATGIADGMTRRVFVDTEKVTQPLLFGYGVASKSDITLNSSAQIGQVSPPVRTDSRANGNIKLNSSAWACGNAIPGPGKSVILGGSGAVCPGYSTTPATAPIVFPEVDDSVARTVNDNNRICKPTLDPCNPLGDVQPNVWDNPSRQLEVNNSGTVTLRGSVYYFCSIRLNSSARLILDPPDTSKPMLIYIGPPSSCPGQPAEVLSFNSSTRVEAAPGKTVPVQFLVAGSESQSTRVSWHSASSATTPTIVYAPNSDVELNSGAKIWGGIVGKSVTLNSSSQVFYDAGVDIDPFDDAARKTASYRECRPQATAGAAPDMGC
jgi:hypothetical protein